MSRPENRDLNIEAPLQDEFFFPEDTLEVVVTTPGNQEPVTVDLQLADQSTLPVEMERTADAAALTAVQRLYGHVAGADDLFEVMHTARENTGAEELPAIFSSHPLDRQRLQAITAAVRANGWRVSGATTPLPAQFATWMEESALRAKAKDDGDESDSGRASASRVRPISPSFRVSHHHPG